MPMKSSSSLPSVSQTRASQSPPATVPTISTARMVTSFVACAAPSAMLVSSAAGTAVVAARGRTTASSARKHGDDQRRELQPLFAWIWWLRLARLATASVLGVEDSEPRSRPSAVGAMWTIDTGPGIRVVGDTSKPEAAAEHDDRVALVVCDRCAFRRLRRQLDDDEAAPGRSAGRIRRQDQPRPIRHAAEMSVHLGAPFELRERLPAVRRRADGHQQPDGAARREMLELAVAQVLDDEDAERRRARHRLRGRVRCQQQPHADDEQHGPAEPAGGSAKRSQHDPTGFCPIRPPAEDATASGPGLPPPMALRGRRASPGPRGRDPSGCTASGGSSSACRRGRR